MSVIEREKIFIFRKRNKTCLKCLNGNLDDDDISFCLKCKEYNNFKKKEETSPTALLKNFYEKLNLPIPKLKSDVKFIKELLEDLTVEQINIVLDYLVKKRIFDLKKARYFVKEALLNDYYEKQKNIVDSPAWLVDTYYKSFEKTHVESPFFLTEVLFIESKIKELGLITVKNILNFLKEKRCPNIYFNFTYKQNFYLLNINIDNTAEINEIW